MILVMTMMHKWQASLMVIYLKMKSIIGKLIYSITWRLMRYIEKKNHVSSYFSIQ
jgi:hypothetical protein